MTTVSVVIPFFNSAHTLARALESVAAQTLSATETIIVDDGSASDQALAAQSIVARFPMMRLVRLEHNCGPSAARNRGIDEARGEFVAFLDADDHWLPEKLRRCLPLMQEKKIDFLGHSNSVSGNNKQSINDRLHPLAHLYSMNRLDIYVSTSQFAPSTVIFRRKAIPVRFDENIRRSEDYRLWGDLVFGGYDLWKLKEFLSVRESAHIKGGGLSGDVGSLLAAHLLTISHFSKRGFVAAPVAFLMRQFLRLKYIRHRRFL